MNRRKFIILSGVGATSATMLTACGNPEHKLIPALIPDEEYVPGIDYWKASTCTMCSANCGILVRTREHKANKIEGNPGHPVNRGALCAKGQAGLQVLYNPDRIKGPMKLVGARGSGQYQEISWDEAIKLLAERLQSVVAQNPDGPIQFVSNRLGGVTGVVAEAFRSAVTVPVDLRDPSWSAVGTVASNQIYDIANSTYLLSFGSRFLEIGRSPVMYSLAYGEFRGSAGKARGRFVQVEPRMSLTGANADEWLPARPGAEGLVALGIAQVISREGLLKNPASTSFLKHPLDMHAPEQTTELTGLRAETVIRIAREFARSPRPLAIGAGVRESGADEMAINLLNLMAGNENKPGGVQVVAGARINPFAGLQAQLAASRKGTPKEPPDFGKYPDYNALMVHHANPVYLSPREADRIRNLPLVVSFSSFMDETTELADLILPDHTYLESWDVITSTADSSSTAVSILQPVIKVEHNTKQTADVLLALSKQLGSTVTFESAEAMVKQSIAQLTKTASKDEDDREIDDIFESFAEKGVSIHLTEPPQTARSASTNSTPVMDFLAQPSPKGDFPLTLVAYQHPTLGMGEQANLPLMQELPDPISSVIWGSWVEINPKTSAGLGIQNGDLVTVETPNGSAKVPAFIHPGIRPEVIAIPSGQGHSSFGRYAKGRGVNVVTLLGSESAGVGLVEARITRTGEKGNMVQFGTELLEHMESNR